MAWHRTALYGFKTLLLIVALLFARSQPVFAQTTEERLDRLERLLERVLERLEDQDARLDALSTQEQEIIEEVQEEVQSERA